MHNLCLCRAVNPSSQTSSDVYSPVLQSQVSSGMVGQGKKQLWIVDHETEQSRTQFIRRSKKMEAYSIKEFFAMFCLPINTKGETSLFTFPVLMLENTKTCSGNDLKSQLGRSAFFLS